MKDEEVGSYGYEKTKVKIVNTLSNINGTM
jgi:hypothetical protein